ncbi:MAG: hypothetical protein ACJ763_07705 [Bdellovibrionia bacterium]
MRKNQAALIFFLAGAILWVGLTSWQSHRKTRTLEKTSAESVAPSAPSAPASASSTPINATSANSNPTDMSAGISGAELEFKMPDRETYRIQVLEREKQEGAGLPPVLREFSVRMAELMEKASQSPVFAAALFDRLKECSVAKRGETIHQARTICAVNAIRLGEIHPQTLGSKATSFREALPARLKTSVAALGF